MPYEIRFEAAGRGVLLRFRGRSTGEEILRAVDAMYAADPSRRLRYQIADFTEAEKLEISEDQLLAIALKDQQALRAYPTQRIAVVGDERLFQGAEKRYAIYADVWAEVRPRNFSTMEEARRWIAEPRPSAKGVASNVKDPESEASL